MSSDVGDRGSDRVEIGVEVLVDRCPYYDDHVFSAADGVCIGGREQTFLA